MPLSSKETFFKRSDSAILRDHTEYEQRLNEYLEPVQVEGKQWELCFRASKHQYSAKTFHFACDNKGPTVTLVRVGDNVFGGYVDKSWDIDIYEDELVIKWSTNTSKMHSKPRRHTDARIPLLGCVVFPMQSHKSDETRVLIGWRADEYFVEYLEYHG